MTTKTNIRNLNFDRQTTRELAREIISEHLWHSENGLEFDAQAWDNAYNRLMDNYRDVKEFDRSLSRYVSNLKYRATNTDLDIDAVFETDAWKRYVANHCVLEHIRTHIYPKFV